YWYRQSAGPKRFHAPSITAALGDAPAATLSAAITSSHAQGTPVSFDLNHREALWRGRDPRPLVEPLVRQAHLLIGNAAAVRAMLAIDADDGSLATRERAQELAEGLAGRFGVERVALTRR